MEERLQKILAKAYHISRRHAETWIQEGTISVNGEIAQLGCSADAERDVIQVGSKRLNTHALQTQTEVWMMYKPKGIMCTHDDPFSQQTLQAILPQHFNKRKWMFVGRLDKESEGLLLLTNDGNFVNRVSHPSANITKTYRVQIDLPFDTALIPQLQKGLLCDGEKLFFKEIYPVNSRKLDIVLSQGKKREIRRLLAAFHYNVLRLKRWKIGQLTLDKKLMPGQCRRLSCREINLIFGTKSE